jgi:hypothetical protein
MCRSCGASCVGAGWTGCLGAEATSATSLAVAAADGSEGGPPDDAGPTLATGAAGACPRAACTAKAAIAPTRAPHRLPSPLGAVHPGDDAEEVRIVGRLRERAVVVRRRGERVAPLAGLAAERAEAVDEGLRARLVERPGVLDPRLEVAHGVLDAEPHELRAKRVAHRAGVGEAVGRVPRERAVEQLAPRGADDRALPLRLGVLPVEHAPQHLRRVRAVERQVADHALVEEDADAEDIGAGVDLAAVDLLRRHVGGAAQHLPGRRHPLHVEELGDPEVGQLDRRVHRRRVVVGALFGGAGGPAEGLEEHVLRLHVPVDHPVGVGVRQRRQELEAQRGRHLGRHHAALLEDLAEGRPANQLGDQVLVVFAGFAHVVDVDDVRMTQLGDGLRLGDEAGDGLARIPQMGVNHLDRDFATQPAVARAIHRGHPAMTELLEEVVLGELGHSPHSCRRLLHRRGESLHQLPRSRDRRTKRRTKAPGLRASGQGVGQELVVVRVERALVGPNRRAREQRVHVGGVPAVDRDDGRGVAHRPVHEGRRVGRAAEDLRVALLALVGEGAGEGGEAAAEQRDAAAREETRGRHRQRLEHLRLAERGVAVALEGVEQGLDEEALLDRRVPRRPPHGALERAPRRLGPPVRRVGRGLEERRHRLVIGHPIDRAFPGADDALDVARHQELAHPPAAEERRDEKEQPRREDHGKKARVAPEVVRRDDRGERRDHEGQQALDA